MQESSNENLPLSSDQGEDLLVPNEKRELAKKVTEEEKGK